MSNQIVVNKVIMFFGRFCNITLSVTGFMGKFVVFVYNIW
jgi:hypothetical protein